VLEASITYDLPERDAVPRKSAEAKVGRAADRLGLWVGLLASAAGLSAYLALLGGGLLAIRFSHAKLPVAAAVSAVPFSTLITTALVEFLLPSSGLAIFGAIYVLYRLDDRQKGQNLSRKKRVIVVSAIVAVFAVTLPPNLYTLAIIGTIIIPFVFADWLLPSTAMASTSTRVFAAAILCLSASLPIFARQAIEPINMERVRIERPGQPALVADLVAIRDSSVVVARCHHLIVLPTPAKMSVEQLPSILGTGVSLTEELGFGTNNIVKPEPMPC
jgi:hypothetical protein